MRHDGGVFKTLRQGYGRALTPAARLLLRMGLSPSAVTLLGTVMVIAAALWFLPRGQLVVGFLTVALSLLADGVDGVMARLADRETRFGAFLDSTMDRLADGAVFVGVTLAALKLDG